MSLESIRVKILEAFEAASQGQQLDIDGVLEEWGTNEAKPALRMVHSHAWAELAMELPAPGPKPSEVIAAVEASWVECWGRHGASIVRHAIARWFKSYMGWQKGWGRVFVTHDDELHEDVLYVDPFEECPAGTPRGLKVAEWADASGMPVVMRHLHGSEPYLPGSE